MRSVSKKKQHFNNSADVQSSVHRCEYMLMSFGCNWLMTLSTMHCFSFSITRSSAIAKSTARPSCLGGVLSHIYWERIYWWLINHFLVMAAPKATELGGSTGDQDRVSVSRCGCWDRIRVRVRITFSIKIVLFLHFRTFALSHFTPFSSPTRHPLCECTRKTYCRKFLTTIPIHNIILYNNTND